MEQLLYWLEPEEKWRSRGYANNQFLRIDWENKTYKLEIGCWFPKGSENEVETKKKSDLKKHIGFLRRVKFNESLT